MLRLALLAVAAIAAMPAWAECLAANGSVSGELRIVETRHPAGHRIVARVLFIHGGGCIYADDLAGGRVELPLRDVQIVPADGEVLAAEDVGAWVTATGEMAVPHTAWHIGSAMMFDARIESVEREAWCETLDAGGLCAQ